MTCYYAKPDQTYREHIEDTYRAWEETIAAKKQLIERMSFRHDFSVERFLKGSLLTLVLHDLGKMAEFFQEMMVAIGQGKKFDYKQNYRHELISFIFTAYAAFGLNSEDGLLTQIPVEALAVAGHHRPLNADLTFFEREREAGLPTMHKEGLKKKHWNWRRSFLPLKVGLSLLWMKN